MTPGKIGWHREPARHALAARGISTRYNQARVERVDARGVGMAFGRKGIYSRTLKKLAKGDSMPPTDVSEADYEATVDPLFQTIAEADELTDRGDLGHARDRLTIALDLYGTMEQIFPAINDSDASDFHSAVDAVTAKLLAANREEIVPVDTNAKAEEPPHEAQ